MAGYTYGGRSEKGGRLGMRFPAWDSASNDAESEWSKPGYGAKAEGIRDHVCRPIIVDAEGKTIPAVFFLPNQQNVDAFVTKRETVTEHVSGPTGYTRISTTKAEIARDYPELDGGFDGGAYLGHTLEFNDRTEVDKRSGFPAGLFQRRTPYTNGYGGPYDSGTKELSRPKESYTYQPKYNAYPGKDDPKLDGSYAPAVTSVGYARAYDSSTKGFGKPKETYADEPKIDGYHGRDEPKLEGSRSPTLSSGGYVGAYDPGMNGSSKLKETNIYQPKTTGYYGKDEPELDGSYAPTRGSGGYVGAYDSGINRLGNPKETTPYQPKNIGYQGKDEPKLDASYPPIVTPGGSNKLKTGGLLDSPVSKPTSNINALANYVKDSGRAASVTTAPPLKKEPPRETIDNREAAKRYGNLPQPSPKIDSSLPTIDSKKAAQLYNGKFVPF